MKIYNYKDGKAFFERNEKKSISDNEYNLLFLGHGSFEEVKSDVYGYFERKAETSKFAIVPLSAILDYVRKGDYTYVKKTYGDIEMTYLYNAGELVYFTNGELATEKGDENWDMFCEELRGIDAEMFK